MVIDSRGIFCKSARVFRSSVGEVVMVGLVRECVEDVWWVHIHRTLRGRKVGKKVSDTDVASLALDVIQKMANSRTSFRVCAVGEWIILEVRYQFAHASKGEYIFPEILRNEFMHALRQRYSSALVHEIGASTKSWIGTWP